MLKKSGFTLVEIIIVIFCIFLLMGILKAVAYSVILSVILSWPGIIAIVLLIGISITILRRKK